jgi:single-stranded-DNA-specific exonuclease
MVEKGYWNQEKAPNLKGYLDLVALGTVADVVELTGINRIFVKAGLEVIAAGTRPGIRALCESAQAGGQGIRSEDIGFRLGPRINAAGRLGQPELAAELLLCRAAAPAISLAKKLEQANKIRRELEKDALGQAVEQAEQQVRDGSRGLVLYDKAWHPGVIGILAARVVDIYDRPVLVFTDDPTGTDEKKLKASGRSVEGLNLFQALGACEEFLLQFGGHALAAGLTVSLEKMEQFTQCFDVTVKNMEQKGVVEKEFRVDRVVRTTDDLGQLVHSLELMEPFGQGNAEPIFLLRNVQMKRVSKLRDHLKFSLQLNGQVMHGIGFFMADHFDITLKPVDLGFKIKETSFRGRKRREAHAVYIAPTN